MQPNQAKIFNSCPASPNCVSSLADNKQQSIAPIPYAGERAAVQQKLLDILNSFNRVRIVKLEDSYIRAEVKSLIFGFVDDVEFLINEDRREIDFRSASRVGYSDLGANRRRMEKIRQAFEK